LLSFFVGFFIIQTCLTNHNLLHAFAWG
jgi:hypothetical protein